MVYRVRGKRGKRWAAEMVSLATERLSLRIHYQSKTDVHVFLVRGDTTPVAYIHGW